MSPHLKDFIVHLAQIDLDNCHFPHIRTPPSWENYKQAAKIPVYDGEKSIRGIGTLLAPYRNIREIRIKLIAYRPMGVREAYSHYQVPSPECLTQLEDILREMGFKDIVII